MSLLTEPVGRGSMDAIVLAVSQDNADALLDGTRTTEHRALPPKRLPARAYLAVVGTGTVVGECVLGERTGRTAKGWTLPVSKPRRYRRARPLADFGMAKTPRSFRYVEK
jgi:predicted transcriptional regulator